MKPALVIAGLGNPGKSYVSTRHNLGFQAVDQLAASFATEPWRDTPRFDSVTAEGRITAIPILLVKPQTYMNLSGTALRKIVDFYKLDPREQLIVLCDDVDLPLGELRLRTTGGPGTHNGLRSVHEQFGDGFSRLRIGLGQQSAGVGDLATWVLSVPPEEERAALSLALSKLPDVVTRFLLESHREDSGGGQ